MASVEIRLDASSPWSFLYLGDQPICLHCHHYNLAVLRTVDDALGPQRGARLRTAASARAWRSVLDAHVASAADASQVFGFASAVFPALGHGRLALDDLGAETFTGDSLHHAMGVREAYDEVASAPVDAYAAGFGQAVLERARGKAPGTLTVEETSCAGVEGGTTCTFSVRDATEPTSAPEASGRAVIERGLEATPGLFEDEIVAITRAFRQLLAGVSGDRRGLIEAFGILVTASPTAYYNALSFEMLRALAEEHPRLHQVSRGLLYEAGRLCGFNTFGSVIASPEWEALVTSSGTPGAEPERVAAHACAIARGFGFGSWSLAEAEPGRMYVFQAPATYEDTYHRASYEAPDEGVCLLFSGACEAIVHLAERVTWEESPVFGRAFYSETMQASREHGWIARQTQCTSMGDPYTEVVVERR